MNMDDLPNIETLVPALCSPSTLIWSGVLEWIGKDRPSCQLEKDVKYLPCHATSSAKGIELDLKVNMWPNRMLMQLLPLKLLGKVGCHYLTENRLMKLNFQQNDSLDALTKILAKNFFGCVHVSSKSSPSESGIKVMLLLYFPDKKLYLGVIPNDQMGFVERLKALILQLQVSKMILTPSNITEAGPVSITTASVQSLLVSGDANALGNALDMVEQLFFSTATDSMNLPLTDMCYQYLPTYQPSGFAFQPSIHLSEYEDISDYEDYYNKN